VCRELLSQLGDATPQVLQNRFELGKLRSSVVQPFSSAARLHQRGNADDDRDKGYEDFHDR
jgi:hypothetical protein